MRKKSFPGGKIFYSRKTLFDNRLEEIIEKIFPGGDFGMNIALI